jgi:Arc/MetJ-type ribon-helix-helix transcriptional regulator
MDDAVKNNDISTTDVTKILSPEQMEWLKGRVESGDFSSIEEAIRSAIAVAQHFDAEPDEDLSWAKPYIDEALADMERGEKGIPAEQVFAELREQVKTFKD